MMTTSTGRNALIGLLVTLGVLVGTPAFASSSPVSFGSSTGTGCEAGPRTCASSDPQVTLAWSSASSTAGCAFRLVVDWGDGTAAQTVRLKGSGAARDWTVAHTFPSSVAARHPYRIHATASVAADSQGLGCTIESASLNFALLCTPAQLSGPAWNSRFPGGDHDVDHLNAGFRRKVKPFLAAMTDAGITVQPQSTLRSPQRSYLMHFSYLVGKGLLAPEAVPAYVPVAGEKGPSVCWLHRAATGRRDVSGSVASAGSLLSALGVDSSLRTAPALRSRHNTGDAIDMKTTWSSSKIKIVDASGQTVTISAGPHDGTNPALIAVGATYGVQHLAPAYIDRNHWSTDGH